MRYLSLKEGEVDEAGKRSGLGVTVKAVRRGRIKEGGLTVSVDL
jgi:hypothetical protein